MSSANKVGEIFEAAGAAFSRLAELTMQLHSTSEQTPSSGRWTDVEIDMLKNAVKRFSEDLNRISEVVKAKSLNQMKVQAKRKAFVDVGLSLPQTVVRTDISADDSFLSLPTKKQKVAEMTLSVLNSAAGDVDVEPDVAASIIKQDYESDEKTD